MEPQEDYPADVVNATPVTDEITGGRKGEASSRHCCFKESPADENAPNCCEVKRQKRKQRNTVRLLMHGKKCRVDKKVRIDRKCLTKEEYLDFLATPKDQCGPDCEKHEVVRRILPSSLRMEELAKPSKRLVMGTLVEKGADLSPYIVDNLIRRVEEGTALTPHAAESIVRKKKAKRRCKKKASKSKNVCAKKDVPCGQPLFEAGDPPMDMDAVNCQYSMARKFVKSILNFRSSVPPDEYEDIAEVILTRMGEKLNYDPVGCEDKASEQMRLLANVLASWIADVLVEVAEKRKEELMAECEREEDDAAVEEDDATVATMSVFDDRGGGDDDEKPELEDAETQTDPFECPKCGGDQDEASFQDDDSDQEPVAVIAPMPTYRDDDSPEESEGEPEEEVKEMVDESLQTCEEKGAQACCPTAEASCETEDPCNQVCKVEDDKCKMLQSELPFITFAKVFETLYCMLQSEPENKLCNRMDNMIHRGIYEKLEDLIKREDPCKLTEKLKDVMDVISGKIAKWLKRSLNDNEMNLLKEHVPKVDSCEVRDWANWLVEAANGAEKWGEFLIKTTKDSNKFLYRQVTRGEWKDFTQEFDSEALLWRRYHVETLHQGHRNIMMIPKRQVLKTGEKDLASNYGDEKITKITNY